MTSGLRRSVPVLFGVVLVGAALLLAACSRSTAGQGAASRRPSVSSAVGTAPASSAAPSSTPVGSPTVARVYLGRCYNPGDRLQVEPARATFGCDGTGDLLAMRWTSWTRAGADGTGIAALRGCTPSCAQGREHHYPVVVHLAQASPVPSVARCAGGASFYAILVVAFPHGFPTDLFGGPAPMTYRGMGAQSYPALPSARC